MAKKSPKQLFAERFNFAMAEAGIEQHTQQQLGQFFNVSGQAVRKWRNAEAIPNSTRAPQVAKKLQVRRAWLIDGELPMRQVEITTSLGEEISSYAAQLSLTKSELSMLSNYRKLSAPVQESISNLLAKLLSK